MRHSMATPVDLSAWGRVKTLMPVGPQARVYGVGEASSSPTTRDILAYYRDVEACQCSIGLLNISRGKRRATIRA